MKVLMVCKGNICRSPLAEGVLLDLCKKEKLNWEIDSAAIIGFHIGEAPDPRAISTAKSRHIDISQQRCRLLVLDDFDKFDVIYAMSGDILDFMLKMAPATQHHKLKLLLNELEPNKNMDVPDPYYGKQEDFDLAYTLILNACQAIIKQR